LAYKYFVAAIALMVFSPQLCLFVTIRAH